VADSLSSPLARERTRTLPVPSRFVWDMIPSFECIPVLLAELSSLATSMSVWSSCGWLIVRTVANRGA